MQTREHHYGSQFHLIDNIFLQTLLTELCQDKTTQPHLNRLIKEIYHGLITSTANLLFPQKEQSVKTRMNHELRSPGFDPSTKAVCVNLARAGTYPSHICYEFLHWILPAKNVRQDHIFASRLTNESEQVTGTHLGGYKIGGEVENSFILFPDPMGATGSTIISAIDTYENKIQGAPKKYIALHLVVTPEYLKKVLRHSPKLTVVALRVDRGLSGKKILESPLGLYWEQEKGLNEKQYIIPGAGGLGELLNNEG